MNSFQAIQEWYVAQCNGEWEQQQGITIESLDNPGWRITIDLRGTALEQAHFADLDRHSDTDHDWLECMVIDHKFIGGCSPRQLGELIQVFIDWVASQPQ